MTPSHRGSASRQALVLAILALLVAVVDGCGASSASPAPGTAMPSAAAEQPAATPEPPAPATPLQPTASPKAPTSAVALRGHPPRTRAAQPTPGTQEVGGIATGPTTRIATRVVVPALGIDLPVMRQRTSYPPCNVAMYLTSLKQPGQGGATYLYAHARTGMFLVLLERSRVNNGSSLLGLEVIVYTGDSRRFVYRIDEVRRHVTDLRYVQRRRGESVWLQTSEGPRGTIPKLQVGAALVSSGRATFAAAHPLPRPINCG